MSPRPAVQEELAASANNEKLPQTRRPTTTVCLFASEAPKGLSMSPGGRRRANKLLASLALLTTIVCAPLIAAGLEHHLKVISNDLGPGELDAPYRARVEHQPMAEALAGGDKPRLIPLVAAESGYSENSSVNFLCTVSQGHHDSLQFDWFKDGHLLGSGAPRQADEVDGDQHLGAISGSYPARISISGNNSNLAPQIERHTDHSLLRISKVNLHHSGRYTCSAKSQFGQDSSSVNLIVNGEHFSILSLLLLLLLLFPPSLDLIISPSMMNDYIYIRLVLFRFAISVAPVRPPVFTDQQQHQHHQSN